MNVKKIQNKQASMDFVYPIVQCRVHTISNPRDFRVSMLVVNLYNINEYLHQKDLLFYLPAQKSIGY